MNLEIRYSPPYELDLSGSKNDLYILNQEIKKFLSGSQKKKNMGYRNSC